MMRQLGAAVGSGLLVLALAGCGTTPRTPDVPPQPAPGRGVGIYKVGKPYQVKGLWYYPNADIAYDETGIASWYGPQFHAQFTANGEIFDQNEVSAAHKTLPLPSIAQVTNLENGRSIRLRINDRGPFAAGRIIDLSRRAAQLLGFEQQGTAEVRVRVLLPETLEAQSLAKLNGGDTAVIAEAPPPPAPTPHQRLAIQSLPPARHARRPAPQPPVVAAPPPVAVAPVPPAVNRPGPARPAPPGPVLPATVLVFPVHPTHIYVQAGAFSSIANADLVQQKLARVGRASISAVRINGENLYRVRLGPFASVDDADAELARAQSAGALDARIVVD